jgi:hypothetical protein
MTSSIQRRLSNIQTGCPHPITQAFVVRSLYREEVVGLEKLLHLLLKPERLRAEWYKGTEIFFDVLDTVLSRINDGGFDYEELLDMPDFVGEELEIMLHRHDFQFLRIRLPLRKSRDVLEGAQVVLPADIVKTLTSEPASPQFQSRLTARLNAAVSLDTMDWTPISEAALWDLIIAAEARMEPREAKLWDCVRIPPQKWSEPFYGTAGGGFWVVGIVGCSVIWYNDVEDGFNYSAYSNFGTIGEYWCDQDELEHTLQSISYRIETGLTNPRAGPPVAGAYNG